MSAKIESSQLTRRRPILSFAPAGSTSTQSPVRLRDILRSKASLDTSALSNVSNTHGLACNSFSYSSPAKQMDTSPSSMRRAASPTGGQDINDSTSVKQLLKLATEIEVLKREMSELRVENHQYRFKNGALNNEITQLKEATIKLEYEKTGYENIIKSLENERDEYQELVIQSSDALKSLQHKNMQLVAAYINDDALKDKEIHNLRKCNHDLVRCVDEYKAVVFSMPHSVRKRASAKTKADQGCHQIAAASLVPHHSNETIVTRIQPSNEEQLLDLDNINELILKVETLIDLNTKDAERQKSVEQSLRLNIDSLIDQIEIADGNRHCIESYSDAVHDDTSEYGKASQRYAVDAIMEEDLSSDA